MAYLNVSEIRRLNTMSLQKQMQFGLDQFAKKVGISPTLMENYIGEHPSKNMGDKISRTVETAFDKPVNWLDHLHVQENKNSTPLSEAKKVPVKATARIDANGDWTKLSLLDEGIGHVFAAHASQHAYAIRVVGDSMFPAIRAGWYMVFDRKQEKLVGEYCHVVLKNGRNMIKELLSCQNGILTLLSLDGTNRMSFSLAEEVHMINGLLCIQPPSALKP